MLTMKCDKIFIQEQKHTSLNIHGFIKKSINEMQTWKYIYSTDISLSLQWQVKNNLKAGIDLQTYWKDISLDIATNSPGMYLYFMK